MKRDLKWIVVICLAGLLGFIGLSTLIAGCGERQESTLYYYGPSWTRAGNVLVIKGLQTVRKDAIGTQLGSAYTETLITMDAAGANETVLLDVTDHPPYLMSAAPAGDYLVYLDGLHGVLFSKAVIVNIAAGGHTGLNKVELSFDPGIRAVDWSNDGRLVYCTTQEVRIIKIDGTGDTLVTAEANLSFVAWKNWARIAFVHTSGAETLLSLIQADGTGRIDLPAVGSVDKPQIDPNNNNIVWGLSGASYCSTNVSALAPATAETFANCKADLPRLNLAGDKVVYGRTGEQTGIYLLDLTAKTETKIKN